MWLIPQVTEGTDLRSKVKVTSGKLHSAEIVYLLKRLRERPRMYAYLTLGRSVQHKEHCKQKLKGQGRTQASYDNSQQVN